MECQRDTVTRLGHLQVLNTVTMKGMTGLSIRTPLLLWVCLHHLILFPIPNLSQFRTLYKLVSFFDPICIPYAIRLSASSFSLQSLQPYPSALTESCPICRRYY
jgi:hypothetical protein